MTAHTSATEKTSSAVKCRGCGHTAPDRGALARHKKQCLVFKRTRGVRTRYVEGRWVAWCTCGCRSAAGSWSSEEDVLAKAERRWEHSGPSHGPGTAA